MRYFDQKLYDEWVEKFKPILDEDGDPKFFGEIDDFILSQPKWCVWTETCDQVGNFNVYNATCGFWNANDMGYYVTEIPGAYGAFVCISEEEIDEEDEEESEEE